jgi:hypothetical protein
VPPVGKQLVLGANEAGTSDDQPALAVDGFCDLRFATVGVVDVLVGGFVDRCTAAWTFLMFLTAIEYCQPICSRYSKTLVF